jgi:hypothetical protein
MPVKACKGSLAIGFVTVSEVICDSPTALDWNMTVRHLLVTLPF